MPFTNVIRTALCTISLCALCQIEARGQERPPKPGNVPDAPGEIISSDPIVTPLPRVVVPRAAVTNIDLPDPVLLPGFGIPDGLLTKPEILFPSLGFGPSNCFVLTPMTCFDAGYKCYSLGMYEDALAFVNHGLKQSNHARLYLLKAVCEMHLGHCEDAGSAILRYRAAAMIPSETFGLGPARERINEPMRVRLEQLLMATR